MYRLLLVGLVATLLACSPDAPAPDGQTADTDAGKRHVPSIKEAAVFEFHNPYELEAFFGQHSYNLEHWQTGDRSVPRLYLQHIPPRWGKVYAPHMPVTEKKEFFFFAIAPLVLAANEEVLADREKLLALLDKHQDNTPWTDEERQWLSLLAEHYGVDGEPGEVDAHEDLLLRVDAVPTSLVLAQAAAESGWGTSRFASEGNALFGQWTWSGEGITPKEQRTATKGNYQIKAFETPEDSVRSYLHNLNTGHAYHGLREHRQHLRSQQKPVTGHDLADGLLKYSERGQAYVDEIRALIRINRLHATDSAYLRDMAPVKLVPVGEGA
ncbi:MAG: glucosaminidase [Gammaproteobacteria bacterium]|nr:MAG: glucosaminidase [Gammaproteobacteria bacterium]